MIQGRYIRLDFRPLHKTRRKTVRIGNASTGVPEGKFENVVVIVKEAYRVTKEGKRKGKIDYVTVNSIPVLEATGDEVFKHVYAALDRASVNKK
jgi:hypothetical protein